MKARNLLIVVFTFLTACYSSLLFADDVQTEMEVPMTVNINEADAETMAAVLDGVGLKKAQDIVAHRETHGRFYLPDELAAVKGIGRTTVLKNEGRILVD
ncbi:MAG: helix-hairpin-helix domain-containing protein [Pseudomonadales bacterium]|nr:helix-hairpin-helix domain-containing protein [Pseudomonadales bacterium]